MLDQTYFKVMLAYFKNDTENFQLESKIFLDISHDLERLLSTNKKFMLGPWLEKAKSFGKITTNSTQKYEFMARNLITLWGPEG